MVFQVFLALGIVLKVKGKLNISDFFRTDEEETILIGTSRFILDIVMTYSQFLKF